MPSSSLILPRLRFWAAVAIAIGLALCALALMAQAMQPDDVASSLPVSSIIA